VEAVLYRYHVGIPWRDLAADHDNKDMMTE